MKAGRAAPSGAPRCGEQACAPLGGVCTSEGSRALYSRLTFPLGPFVLLEGTVKRSCLCLRTERGAQHPGRGEVGKAMTFAGTAGWRPCGRLICVVLLTAPVADDDSLF